MAKSSRPEVFRREFEEASAELGAHYKFPDKPYPHSILLVFKEYDYKGLNAANGSFNSLLNTQQKSEDGSRASGFGLRAERAVELPFPKQLQDTSGLIINSFSRDPLMESLADKANQYMGSDATLNQVPGMIQGMGANLAGLFSGSGDGLGEFTKSLSGTTLGDSAQVGKYLMRKMAGDSQLGRAIDVTSGQTLNPRETLAFEGVQLRQHQFNWELYPSNEGDSNRIKEIVKIMKRSVLPVTADFNNIAKAFLKYPHTVDIYLLGVDAEHFIKFKPAMVTNMTVDYGAGGNLAIMKGGKPAGVSISLQLQELQIETADDYSVGTTGG